MTRHAYFPDTQIRPGVPTDHIAWCAEYMVEKKPDTIVVGGDWWDNPTCSDYEQPGSLSLEGGRIQNDIWVGNEAFKKFNGAIRAEVARQKKNRKDPWTPRKMFTFGNHEDRLDRIAARNAKWEGLIGTELCDTQDFERFAFLRIAWVDGVAYSHYFSSPHSGKSIGGTAQNRITKIGSSFVQGHQQGLDFGTKLMGNGKTLTGVIAGSCYTHIENYRGNQGQRHFRGLVMLNEVRDGEFQPMSVSLDFLCKKYEGMSLFEYHRKKYPRQKWEHLK